MSEVFFDLTELSPEELEVDRKVAAFLAYAAKRDPAFAQYDPAQGLCLRHAMLVYGDPARAKLYEALDAWGFGRPDRYGDLTLFRAARRLSSEELCSKLAAGELRAADVMKPPFVDRHDRVSQMLRSKYRSVEGELHEALVEKLLRGERRATGFLTNHPLDSSAAAISPDRWRILIPDFDESSALCFSGIKVEGILVFPGPASCPNRLGAQAGKVGRKSMAKPMLEALAALNYEGQIFSSIKEEHRAVLIRLGVREGTPGCSYKTFAQRRRRLL